jgi:hypothetical protein
MQRMMNLLKKWLSGARATGCTLPTLEGKVLQRAVLMVLEPVYEQDFLDRSYGFRPGSSAHQALEALWQGLMGMGVDGSLTSTSRASSMTSIGATCGAFWTNGCVSE